MGFAQWIEDVRWAANVRRARAWRRSLPFSRRVRFDDALRHVTTPLGCTRPVMYPDAFYMTTIDDLCRAMLASSRRSEESDARPS